MITSIFINMPIADLKRSVDFFTELGFTFNPQFTSEDTTCMLVGPNIFAMLLERDRFTGFIDKPVADTSSSEVILSLGCESQDEVRKLAEAAFALGARKVNEIDDKGFMISWGFEDLDGHLWDLFWMDPKHVEG